MRSRKHRAPLRELRLEANIFLFVQNDIQSHLNIYLIFVKLQVKARDMPLVILFMPKCSGGPLNLGGWANARPNALEINVFLHKCISFECWMAQRTI